MQAKDFKPAATRPAGGGGQGKGGRGMPPMLTGIIIGLLLGIMLALGVAIWLNRAHNPFFEKSKPVDALPTIAARPTPAPVAKSEKAESDKPRFEFYQILPGDKGGGGSERVVQPNIARAPTSPEAKATAKTEGVAPKEVPKHAATETVFLQAGAFQSETDAENLKAKIAFSGFEANVRPVNFPDKGTLFRVRLGPYKSTEEVNRIKATLSQNGINAAVVKAAD